MSTTATSPNKTKVGNGWGSEVKVVHKKTVFDAVENSEVFESLDYNLFSFDLKNRPIDESKVAHFMKDFKGGDCFMFEFPAIVDSDLRILDGQHRFEACRRLGIVFYFRYAKTLTINNVVKVQVNAGWKTNDFLHAFIKQKKQDYVVLHRFIQRYKITHTVAVMLLADNSNGSLKKSGYYEGTFAVKDEDKAHKNAKLITEIGELALKLHRDAAFCLAVIRIKAHPEYDHKRMVAQLTKYSSLVRRHMTIDNYIRNLEEIYNYRLFTKNKVRFV